jgi:hypothetical protein
MRTRRHSLLAGLLAVALLPVTASAALPKKDGDKSELGGLPRFQQALRMLEDAHAYLEVATERAATELREPAKQAAEDVNTAITWINSVLDKHNVGRESRRGQVDPTKQDQPIAAARESLDAARAQLDSVNEKYEVDARPPKARIRQATETLEEANQKREREQAKRKGK